MSMHQVNPADHFGANRNLNNYVAKQVVAQALRLNTTPSPTENEQADAAGAPPSREAEPVLVSSTVAPAPVSESEEASPPRQYAGEAQLMAAILDWQRNLRKELEADNLATEHPPAGSDSNDMAKLVVAQAVGRQPEPTRRKTSRRKPLPARKLNLCSCPQWRNLHPNWKKQMCPLRLRLRTNCPRLPCRSRLG